MANQGVVESIKSWQRRDVRAHTRMQRVVASHTGECRNVGKARDGKLEKLAKDEKATEHAKPRDGYSLCDACLAHRRATAKQSPSNVRPKRAKKPGVTVTAAPAND